MFIDFHTHKTYIDHTKFVRSLMIDELPEPPEYFFTIGLHPWFASQYNIKQALWIIELFCKSNNCIAIGEIGLDKTKQNFDIQEKNFIAQLDLAQSLNKPVVIHSVRTYDKILSLRKKYKLTPWAIHGFNGNKNTALQLISKDIFLSFGHNLLHPSQKLLQAFVSTPTNKIFLETDIQKIHIKNIYSQAQAILNQDIEQQIQKNFQLFIA